ncbi:unnamed protein product [Caenorhabditis bovis]|uniref:G-patch domain-containing protein n=1 Tax=Caenorhabditis bovis TaxID=2654633 RepID=A0A8S1ED49_9PELO|nr:unnamed protein product [Caenorhabditis bovis]
MKKISNKEILNRFFAKKKEECSRTEAFDNSSWSYVVIRNIPKELHSKDLRKYFKGYIEHEKFACFHYRHRPEVQAKNDDVAANKSRTCCCIVAFKNMQDREEFTKEFHGRLWQNSEGTELMRRCFIDRLKVESSTTEASSSLLSREDLKEMIELKPPAVMPQGNIGTPSQYFLEQIRQCKLPSSLIQKLGIQSGRRKRKFEAVPFNYKNECMESNDHLQENSSNNKNEIFKNPEKPLREESIEEDFLRQKPPDNDEGPDDDDDQCEEWERHEALHDDVTEQDRTKPKKYEEEMEVTWEKGGPGLVWYTDKNYWDEREKGTDCDWAWADDWDVDYSVYYEGKSAGDLDAKAAVEMQEDELLRSGKLEKSVFTRRAKNPSQKTRKRKYSENDDLKINNIVGNRLLIKMGWKPGTGLGRNQQGRVAPVAFSMEEDGQSGMEKKGLGYRGEKLIRTTNTSNSTDVITKSMPRIPMKHVMCNENDFVVWPTASRRKILIETSQPSLSLRLLFISKILLFVIQIILKMHFNGFTTCSPSSSSSSEDDRVPVEEMTATELLSLAIKKRRSLYNRKERDYRCELLQTSFITSLCSSKRSKSDKEQSNSRSFAS